MLLCTTFSGVKVRERRLIASGLRLTCSVASLDPAVDTFHLEVKEKLESLISNLDLEKAETVLCELNPHILDTDLALRADMSLARLYTLMKADNLDEAMNFATNKVLPLIHGKAIVRYSDAP